MKRRVKHTHSDAHARIKSLPLDVLREVDKKLLAGDTPRVLAAWLQGDMKLWPEINHESARKALQRYQNDELKEKTFQRIIEATANHSQSAILKRINAMDELESLMKVQKSRVEKLLTQEQNLPKGILLTTASNEINSLKGMLVDLGKLQLETGIIARAPRTLKGTMTDPTGQTSAFVWTEEQEQLYKELEGVEYTSET